MGEINKNFCWNARITTNYFTKDKGEIEILGGKCQNLQTQQLFQWNPLICNCYTTLKVVFFSERAEAINNISAITINDKKEITVEQITGKVGTNNRFMKIKNRNYERGIEYSLLKQDY